MVGRQGEKTGREDTEGEKTWKEDRKRRKGGEKREYMTEEKTGKEDVETMMT